MTAQLVLLSRRRAPPGGRLLCSGAPTTDAKDSAAGIAQEQAPAAACSRPSCATKTAGVGPRNEAAQRAGLHAMPDRAFMASGRAGGLLSTHEREGSIVRAARVGSGS
jgi:hypothetical protein